REIDDSTHTLAYDLANIVRVGDVAADKPVLGIAGQFRQVGKVASIGKQVKIDNRDCRIFLQQIPDKVTTNKTAATRHENPFHADSPVIKFPETILLFAVPSQG